MPQNTLPIFTKVPEVVGSIWTSSLTANTKSDGTGTIATDMVKAFTGDATNGSFVNKLRFTPSASFASTATTASVIRVYASTIASGATTRADTFLIGEFAVAAQTADVPTSAVNFFEFPINAAIPANATILWSMHHAAAANTSWQCVAFAGDY
ncbi:MAG: hypothetical protein PSV22_14335 [Pseudolabrys sp.]|nr:hypothetical protein [Pseudolabrys sp.]